MPRHLERTSGTESSRTFLSRSLRKFRFHQGESTGPHVGDLHESNGPTRLVNLHCRKSCRPLTTTFPNIQLPVPTIHSLSGKPFNTTLLCQPVRQIGRPTARKGTVIARAP